MRGPIFPESHALALMIRVLKLLYVISFSCTTCRPVPFCPSRAASRPYQTLPFLLSVMKTEWLPVYCAFRRSQTQLKISKDRVLQPDTWQLLCAILMMLLADKARGFSAESPRPGQAKEHRTTLPQNLTKTTYKAPRAKDLIDERPAYWNENSRFHSLAAR